MTPDIPTSCIYAWHWANYPEVIKVGYTTAGARRFSQRPTMPPDLPNAAVPDLGERVFVDFLPTDQPRSVEAMAHLLLSRHRDSGEWFRISPEAIRTLFGKLADLIADYAPTDETVDASLLDDDADDLPLSLD